MEITGIVTPLEDCHVNNEQEGEKDDIEIEDEEDVPLSVLVAGVMAAGATGRLAEESLPIGYHYGQMNHSAISYCGVETADGVEQDFDGRV